VPSNSCGDFAEAALNKLLELGARMRRNTLVCKPYFTIISGNRPTPVIRGARGQAPFSTIFRSGLMNWTGNNLRTSSFDTFTTTMRSLLNRVNFLQLIYVDGENNKWSYSPTWPFMFQAGAPDNYQRALLTNQVQDDATENECGPFMEQVWSNFKAFNKGIPRQRSDDEVCPTSTI